MWFILSCLIVATASAAAATAPSQLLDDSASVRALDEFGNARQLEYAKAAATQQSSLTIVLQQKRNDGHDGDDGDDDDTLVVVSVPQQASSLHQRTTTPLVQALTSPSSSSPSSPSSSSSSFIICTGFQGDARWLTTQLRAYANRLWTTQNTVAATTGGAALADAAASLLRLFWNHPPHLAVTSPTLQQQILQNGDNDSTMQWARPMGVQVVLISLLPSSTTSTSTTTTPANTAQAPAPWQVRVVDPAGNVSKIQKKDNDNNKEPNVGFEILACLGRDHDVVRQALEQKRRQQQQQQKSTRHQGINDDGYQDDTDEWLDQVIIPVLIEALGTVQVVHVQTLSAQGVLGPVQVKTINDKS